ncbi:hypothetical protein LP52_05435 [Streptomonospora alba]|uniref:Uncharacterized protein n=1 Tax=Streptomonospora alba TaxID=183763 RepID=A0A0C2G8J0_9ACTN|nr:hypothetical protein LP52_05435 [Streptomonospora alba]
MGLADSGRVGRVLLVCVGGRGRSGLGRGRGGAGGLVAVGGVSSAEGSSSSDAARARTAGLPDDAYADAGGRQEVPGVLHLGSEVESPLRVGKLLALRDCVSDERAHLPQLLLDPLDVAAQHDATGMRVVDTSDARPMRYG